MADITTSETKILTSRQADFLQNVQMVENALFNSKSFQQIKDSGLDRDTQAQLVAEIFKQAVQGAVQMSELENKQKADALALKKQQTELELAILTAKAQVKLAQAQAMKELVQCKSMIRSVSDNAAINRANGFVAYGNVLGSATSTTPFTQRDTAGISTSDQSNATIQGITGNEKDTAGNYTYTDLVLKTLSLINVKPVDDFDTQLGALISADDNYGCKEVLIHAAKAVIYLGEIAEFTGFSSLGENKTKFEVFKITYNADKTAISSEKSLFSQENTKSLNYLPQNAGDYKITFSAMKSETGTDWEKDENLSDSVMVSVIDSSLNKDESKIRKF